MNRLKYYLPLAVLVLVPLTGWGELSRVFPTSAVATVRVSAYQDGLNTIGKSTYTVSCSTWVVFGSSWTFIYPQNDVKGYLGKFETIETTRTWKVSTHTWTFQDYINEVVEQTKNEVINEVLDHDFEQYMVFPGTNPAPGWKGFCSLIIGGKVVPQECP